MDDLYNFYSDYKNYSLDELWNNLDVSIKKQIGTHKGMVGEIFEGLSGRAPNNSQEPDISNLGIDLKVIPVRELNRGGFTVKERSKITSLNYSKLRNESWSNSSVKYKSNILYNVYEVPHGCSYDELDKMVFFGPILFTIDESEHLEQIKEDWIKIHDLVFNLKAHTLSSSITKLLEASTSGSGTVKKYHPKAPNATERSFSYKPKLLRLLLYESMGKYGEKENVYKESLEVDIFDLIKKYFSKRSISSLTTEYGIKHSNNKSLIHQLIRKILKISEDQEIRELHQNNISIKTIPINPDTNSPWEAMSFPKISLADLANEEWMLSENSTKWESPFKIQLMEEFIFLPIYKKKIKLNGKPKFVNSDEWLVGEPKKWIFSEKLLENIGIEWNHCKEMVTKNRVRTRTVPWGKKTRQENNLPKMSQTKYIHLRPHTSDSSNIDEPFRNFTKGKISIPWQSFWLNKFFVRDIINNDI